MWLVSKSTRSAAVPRRSARRNRKKLTLYLAILLICVVALITLIVVAATIAASESTPSARRDDDYSWPASGHAAVAWGDEMDFSPNAPADSFRPGSIAKLITALVVLDRAPLQLDEEGPTFVLSEQHAARTVTLANDDAATAPAPAGAAVSQRQALALALVGSACNYAEIVAEQVYGSMPAFLSAAQEWLDEHDLADTRLADPCGISEFTVSTASDLLALGAIAHADPIVAAIAAQPFAVAPDGAVSRSLNSLLGVDGVDGLKTGHPSEGQYLMLATAPVGGDVAIVLVWASPSAAQRATDALRLLAGLRATADATSQ
jgi:D-alanyl-D-alanine carboxypeptidase (penicillin-binding protein 5/6)